jgi:hypothetical protein
MATDLEAVAKPMTLAQTLAWHERQAHRAQYGDAPKWEREKNAAFHTEAAAAIRAAMAALGPFAAFYRPAPPSLVITQGSALAAKQLTMGDCERAALALGERP